MVKVQKLFESGHVLEVEEKINQDNEDVIIRKVLPQTKISSVYDVTEKYFINSFFYK